MLGNLNKRTGAHKDVNRPPDGSRKEIHGLMQNFTAILLRPNSIDFEIISMISDFRLLYPIFSAFEGNKFKLTVPCLAQISLI